MKESESHGKNIEYSLLFQNSSWTSNPYLQGPNQNSIQTINIHQNSSSHKNQPGPLHPITHFPLFCWQETAMVFVCWCLFFPNKSCVRDSSADFYFKLTAKSSIGASSELVVTGWPFSELRVGWVFFLGLPLTLSKFPCWTMEVFGVFQTVLGFVLLYSPVIVLVCCFQVFSGLLGILKWCLPRPSSYFFRFWNISWAFFPVPGICIFQAWLPGAGFIPGPVWLYPAVPLGVLSWRVSLLCSGLLRSLFCKMCAIYFYICKQSPRNSSSSSQGDLKPGLLINMRCETQLYCQPGNWFLWLQGKSSYKLTYRHQDPKIQRLTRGSCDLLTAWT